MARSSNDLRPSRYRLKFRDPRKTLLFELPFRESDRRRDASIGHVIGHFSQQCVYYHLRSSTGNDTVRSGYAFCVSAGSAYITRRRGRDGNVDIYANADITIYRYINIQRARSSVGESAMRGRERKR
jgi:hypothetical protein